MVSISVAPLRSRSASPGPRPAQHGSFSNCSCVSAQPLDSMAIPSGFFFFGVKNYTSERIASGGRPAEACISIRLMTVPPRRFERAGPRCECGHEQTAQPPANVLEYQRRLMHRGIALSEFVAIRRWWSCALRAFLRALGLVTSRTDTPPRPRRSPHCLERLALSNA